MKKTISILVAVAAAGLACAATTPTSYTISTEMVGEGSADGINFSLFDYVKGHNSDYITNVTNAETFTEVDIPVNGAVYEAKGGGYSSVTLSLASLTTNTLPEFLAIDSFAFITRADNTTVSNITLSILDGDKVLCTSGTVSYDSDAGTSNYGVGTFTFTNGATLDTSKEYTFQIRNANGVATTVQWGEFKTWYSTPSGQAIGNGFNIEGDHLNYHKAVQITAHAIPEPATATLSLLALAGLAARRRK